MKRTNRSINFRVRHLMKRSKIRTIYALAQKTGINQQTLGEYFLNKSEWTFENICIISRVLDISLDWLVFGEERTSFDLIDKLEKSAKEDKATIQKLTRENNRHKSTIGILASQIKTDKELIK